MIHARDQLEKVLTDLARHQVGKIFLVGHSMGSLLVVETLRQMSLDGNHVLNGGLSGVTLLSPDIDVQVFKRLLERIKPVPQPFLVFISHRDHVLRLAAQLTGIEAVVQRKQAVAPERDNHCLLFDAKNRGMRFGRPHGPVRHNLALPPLLDGRRAD